MNNLKDFFSYCFRRIVSNNFVRKTTKLFHINKIGKSVFFKIFVPKDKKISHTVEGISAQFYVKNYTEL